VDSILWKPTFTEFNEYIVNGPRNYTVLVFFTSGNTTWCQACPLIKEEMEDLSNLYSPSVSEEDRDLFFALIEFESHKSYSTYKEQIVTIPSLFLLSSTTKKGSQFKVDEKDRFVFQQDFSAETVAKFINKKLGVTKIIIPEISMNNIYIVSALAGFITLYFIYTNRQKKALWTVLALLFPWFTYTGTYFNLSHLPPFIYKQGVNSVIIFPSQQMQTILEGLLVSCLIVFMGIMFAFFITFVPLLRYSYRRLAFYPLLLVMVALLYVYFYVWKIKSPWYFEEINRLSFIPEVHWRRILKFFSKFYK
jgi:thiol-disulfide isomerase/thioredoxin